MRCEWCETSLPKDEPENIVLLQHVQQSTECNQQFEYSLENLRTSWTANMSGG